jgi:hypothetical protein
VIFQHPTAKLEVFSEILNPFSYAVKTVVSNPFTKCYSVIDNSSGTPVENFIVYGNGQVYCREVFVKLGVLGDFVFDEDYKLLSYQELRRYIKENKHLPGVPAEKIVLAGGLNVGEMIANVLQKTEENTLYILDLNDRVEQLENENKQLKDQLESMNKRLSAIENRK